jgi:hypothetical protein
MLEKVTIALNKADKFLDKVTLLVARLVLITGFVALITKIIH